MSKIGTRRVGAFAAIVLFALSSVALGWWLSEEWSGTTNSAEAEAKLTRCHDVADTFEAYPLVYLGDSFEGLPLTYCARKQTAGSEYGRPPTDRFVFIYGDCVIEPQRDSCSPPLQVTIYPRCGPQLAGGVIRTELIRETTTRILATPAFFVETQNYNVKVSGGSRTNEGEDLARRAVEQLRGANALAERLTADEPLSDSALISLPAKEDDACVDENTLSSNAAPQP
ncbi:MAG: hypothetical protein WEC75_06605 [Dehalococcoidia bacterium]